MTTCLGVPFVNCRHFSYFPFGFEGMMWDLIVSVPDHFLYFYFSHLFTCTKQTSEHCSQFSNLRRIF